MSRPIQVLSRVMHLTRHQPPVLRAATTAVFVLVQALALQLFCLCGHCPRSWAVGVGEPLPVAHACCHHAAAEEPGAQLRADSDCCGAKHTLATVPAVERSQVTHSPDVSTHLAIEAPLLADSAVLPPVRLHTPTLARGPPGSGPPLYLRQLAFLI
jgi:hypothetical protein